MRNRCFGALFFCLILLLLPTKTTFGTESESTTQAKPPKSEPKRTGGIVGDPSHKRGVELGFDAGLKALKDEKEPMSPQQMSLRPEFNPESFYRYEFGSRLQFIAGFRSGFAAAYRQSGRKVEVSQPPNLGIVRQEKPLKPVATRNSTEVGLNTHFKDDAL